MKTAIGDLHSLLTFFFSFIIPFFLLYFFPPLILFNLIISLLLLSFPLLSSPHHILIRLYSADCIVRASQSVISGVGALCTYTRLVRSSAVSDAIRLSLSGQVEARPKVHVLVWLTGTSCTYCVRSETVLLIPVTQWTILGPCPILPLYSPSVPLTLSLSSPTPFSLPSPSLPTLFPPLSLPPAFLPLPPPPSTLPRRIHL